MLMNRRILSALDHERLVAAVDHARNSWTTYAPNLDFFRAELRRAQALDATDVPPDVITMNSRFALRDARTDEVIAYELVYPEYEAPRHGKISVLSPMGMAVFGAYVGDDVCWDSADGPAVATVERVLYQPEAQGHPRR
jgi:regulator of nucleoside diphosphate kinase